MVADLCSRRQNRLRLRVEGEASHYRMQLEASGVAVLGETNAGDWRVTVPEGFANLTFFQLAEDNAVSIRALLRDDETLEELFLRMVMA
jgi:ABC-2 type transport system ATP-binding protein